jgi:hypothetical protein
MAIEVAVADASLTLDMLALDALRTLALDALLPLDALRALPFDVLALDALGPDALDVPRASLDDPLLALGTFKTHPLLALRALETHPLLALRPLHANALLALRSLELDPLLALRSLHADALDALLALRPSLLRLGLRRLGLRLGLLGPLLMLAARLGLGGSGDCKRRDGRDQKGFGHRKISACLDSGHFGENRLITI